MSDNRGNQHAATDLVKDTTDFIGGVSTSAYQRPDKTPPTSSRWSFNFSLPERPCKPRDHQLHVGGVSTLPERPATQDIHGTWLKLNHQRREVCGLGESSSVAVGCFEPTTDVKVRG